MLSPLSTVIETLPRTASCDRGAAWARFVIFSLFLLLLVRCKPRATAPVLPCKWRGYVRSFVAREAVQGLGGRTKPVSFCGLALVVVKCAHPSTATMPLQMMLLLALIALASATVADQQPAAPHKLILTPMSNVTLPSPKSKFECDVCLNFVYVPALGFCFARR